ncbi:UNVERIFIED_CONTAM: hypothetical protein FKN15_006701 [Acipenser sinensis]
MQCLSVSDSHLAELDGETLRLFGLGALEALERGWGVQTAGAVTAIAFRYIDYDAIVPTLPRIRIKFPSVTHLIFSETNVHRLPQLAALAQVRQLDQLTVYPEGNPVVSLALWRSFAIFRLSHFNLQRINGEEVTMNDVIMAERLFGTLAHIAAAETPHYRLLLLLGESRQALTGCEMMDLSGMWDDVMHQEDVQNKQAHYAATSELQRRRTTQLWAVYGQARRRPARPQGSLVSDTCKPGLPVEDRHGRCSACLGLEHAKEELASRNSCEFCASFTKCTLEKRVSRSSVERSLFIPPGQASPPSSAQKETVISSPEGSVPRESRRKAHRKPPLQSSSLSSNLLPQAQGPFSGSHLQYWLQCTTDTWVLNTVQTVYSLQFRHGPPPFRGVTTTLFMGPIVLSQEVTALLQKRKHQLQFLLEGRGRQVGLSPVELRKNRKLLGEGLGRAIFSYPSRDGDTDRSEYTGQERAQVSRCYVQRLVREAASTNLKGESLHKLWSSLFMELVRDSVVEMRDRSAFRRDCLQSISESK